MNFFTLGAVVALAVFAAGSLAGSLVAAGVFTATRGGAQRAPASRARFLFALRLLPTALGAVLSLFVFLPAWWAFERRDTDAVPGLVVQVLALTAVVLSGAGLWRGLRAALVARRTVRAWRERGRPLVLGASSLPAYAVDEAFPVVATGGFAVPTLFVADRVLRTCDDAELRAMVAHEEEHARARDNLKALLLRAGGDVLGTCGMGGRMERAWREAAEQAADAAAARTEASAGADLASALLKVARLAGGRTFVAPGCAVHAGGEVAARVRLLLGERPDAGKPRRPWPALAAMPALYAAVVLGPEGVLRAVHRAGEWFLRL